MTPEQKIAKGHRAKAAMDEFFGPALDAVEAEYAEKIISVAASTDPRAPEVITRLANGVSVARQLRGKIEAHIHDGESANRDAEQSKRLDDMSPSARRLVGIGRV